MDKGETIAYAIFKNVSEYSFINWLEEWGISREEWELFMEAGKTAVNEKQK